MNLNSFLQRPPAENARACSYLLQHITQQQVVLPSIPAPTFTGDTTVPKNPPRPDFLDMVPAAA
jgi:hypothetical protein